MANSKEKNETKSKNELRKKKFYYSFLTIILLFCLIQIGFSALRNLSKLIAFNGKMNTLKKSLNEAEIKNKNLNEELKQYSSSKNLEGIARNTLKMAGEDEVLIIITNPNKEENTEKNKKQEAKHAQ